MRVFSGGIWRIIPANNILLNESERKLCLTAHSNHIGKPLMNFLIWKQSFMPPCLKCVCVYARKCLSANVCFKGGWTYEDVTFRNKRGTYTDMKASNTMKFVYVCKWLCMHVCDTSGTVISGLLSRAAKANRPIRNPLYRPSISASHSQHKHIHTHTDTHWEIGSTQKNGRTLPFV